MSTLEVTQSRMAQKAGSPPSVPKDVSDEDLHAIVSTDHHAERLAAYEKGLASFQRGAIVADPRITVAGGVLDRQSRTIIRGTWEDAEKDKFYVLRKRLENYQQMLRVEGAHPVEKRMWADPTKAIWPTTYNHFTVLFKNWHEYCEYALFRQPFLPHRPVLSRASFFEILISLHFKYLLYNIYCQFTSF